MCVCVCVCVCVCCNNLRKRGDAYVVVKTPHLQFIIRTNLTEKYRVRLNIRNDITLTEPYRNDEKALEMIYNSHRTI